MDAAAIIETLGMQPHPEGGHFVETFRDGIKVDGRSVGTAIYFLLQAGEVSRWHKVDAETGAFIAAHRHRAIRDRIT